VKGKKGQVKKRVGLIKKVKKKERTLRRLFQGGSRKEKPLRVRYYKIHIMKKLKRLPGVYEREGEKTKRTNWLKQQGRQNR